MTRRHVIAGFAGAALATLGLLLGGGFARADTGPGGAADPAVTTTGALASPIVADNESLIGNTLFIPLDVREVGGAAVLEYELVPLGGPVLTAAPERFELTAADGTQYTASIRTEQARQVRFEGAGEVEVAEIAVTQWRFRMYEQYHTTFSLSEPTTLSDGTRLVVERVLDESVGALVYFDITTGINHGFGNEGFMGPLLVTQGIGWQDVLNADFAGSAGASPSLAVTMEPVPDPVPVLVVARPWVAVEERIVVVADGAES